MKTFYTILAFCFFAVLTDAQVQIKVDVANEVKEISPYIYGRNNNLSDDSANPVTNATWQLYKDAGLTFFRESSGNNSTKYNWRLKLSSHPDWYNNVNPHDWDYAATSLQENMPGTKGMWALQLIGYAAMSDAYNFDCWAYNECVWTTDVNNNWCADGDWTKYLELWPADSTVGILNQWFNVLGLSKDQFQYWNMDNEPEVWNSTHDDVMPTPISVEEYIQKYVAVAVKARTLFPDIKIVGPVFTNEWQWYNWQNNEKISDPKDLDVKYTWVEYFIKRIAEEQARTGLRLLDVLDFHFYPEFKTQDQAKDVSPQLYRVFYDETYDYPLANGCKVLSPSGWDNSMTKEYIFKRADDWLTQYMGENHGVTMGISEFGNMYEDDPNVVAVTYASLLGTFAEHNVEIFSPWYWETGQWEVLHLFTHYAGTAAVASTSSNDSLVSAYSSVNESKDTVTVILVNRDANNAQTISTSLENGTTNEREALFYRLSDLPKGQETFISEENNALEEGTVEISNRYYFSMTLPKLSVTAVRIPLEGSSVGCSEVLNDVAFRLYPNPATSQTRLMAKGLTGDVVITVTDMLGRTLKTIQAKADGSQLETMINVSDWGKGVYFVKLQAGGISKSEKLIVR